MIEDLRKLVVYDEEVLMEGGRKADPPLRTIAVGAVLKNPWHGRGFVDGKIVVEADLLAQIAKR